MLGEDRQATLTGMRALAHPLRMRILSLLTGTAMSAAEVARELGDSQPNISYHLRRLLDAGLLEIAEEVQIRGGTAKRYRHDPSSASMAFSGSADEHHLLIASSAAELTRRGALRDPSGPGTWADAELWVDPEVWESIVSRVRELEALLHAAALPPHTPGTVPVSATIALFQLAAD